MRKFFKTGLLLFMLVVPVSLFVFLTIFGENHFDIPHFHPLQDAVSGESVIVDGDTVYYRVSNFELQDEQGRLVNESAFDNQFTLVYAPSDICGEGVRKPFGLLKRYLGQRSQELPKLQFMLITGQPFDTANTCLKRLDLIGPFLTLSGDSARKERMIADVLKMDDKSRVKQTFSPDERLILIDRNRNIRGYYDLVDEKEADRLAAELKIMQKNFP